MLFHSMTECLTERTEPFEPTIESLMTGSGNRLHALIKVVVSSWGLCLYSIVNTVGKELFAGQQAIPEPFLSRNFVVCPVARCNGSFDPNYMPGLNADPDLVPQAGAIQLVGPPACVERPRFLNGEINTIDCNQTDASIGSQKSIIPNNLMNGTVGE